ncbi:hypothetical protein DYB35_004601 [Aphanomyces astaci]|uniref:Uncharacterized protein n=1 Tax=Aphanomyces astaci TaxID=112090 RepID=A0A418D5G5_APHAT|nr:hypothetical protein DYB35_004601 [Aphanomyces astaci]
MTSLATSRRREAENLTPNAFKRRNPSKGPTQVRQQDTDDIRYLAAQALKDIHEGASETGLLTLMTEISNLRWTSDIAFDDFTDKYCELVRKLETASDLIPESAYATKLL